MKNYRCIKEFYANSDNNKEEYLVEKLSLWDIYYLGWTDEEVWGVNKDNKKMIQVKDGKFREYFEEIQE